ncbi:MAG: endonuclease, partial [Alphaproteobacteria bacterium]|nr:endonuclease [Alphaproteobacteria bacterium]
LSFDANGMETEINSIIFDKYGISKCEKQIIVDFANFTKSLMIKSVSNIVCATRSKEIIDYLKVICSSLNDFLDNQDLFVNGTLYSLQYNTPLVMIKISFGSEKHDIVQSDLTMRSALIKLDKYLWAQKGSSVYFRKNLNHYDGNDIYIIRPNQRRFWTQSAAMQDASNLIIEILNMEG